MPSSRPRPRRTRAPARVTEAVMSWDWASASRFTRRLTLPRSTPTTRAGVLDVRRVVGDDDPQLLVRGVEGGHHLGRGDESLRRHAVGEHRRPAQTVAVDDGHLRAELGGHQGRLVSAGSATDDHDPSHVLHCPARHAVAPPGGPPETDHALREAAHDRLPYPLSMSLYAAYAGNLDARLMTRRAPHSPLRATGWLNGLAADVRRRADGLGGRAGHARRGRRRTRSSSRCTTSPRWTRTPWTAGRASASASTAACGCGCTRWRARNRPGCTCSRLRGRPALGALPGRDRGRGGVGGAPARLCDGAAQAPLLQLGSQPGARRLTSSARLRRASRPAAFVGNDKTTIAIP